MAGYSRRGSGPRARGAPVKRPLTTDETRRLTMAWVGAQPAVAAFIASLVRSPVESEEVLQRTASAAVERFHGYDQARPFVAWALGLARVEVMRHRDVAARRPSSLSPEAIEALLPAFERTAAEVPAMRQALQDCLLTLRDRARRLLELHHVRQLDASGLAEIFGLTVDAVYAGLHRARTALRRCVERRLGLGERTP